MTYSKIIGAGWYHIDGYTVRRQSSRNWVVYDIIRRPQHAAGTLRECRKWIVERATEAS